MKLAAAGRLRLDKARQQEYLQPCVREAEEISNEVQAEVSRMSGLLRAALMEPTRLDFKKFKVL